MGIPSSTRFAAPFAVAAALMAWVARVPDVGPWTLGELVPRLGPPTLAALAGAAVGAALTARSRGSRGAVLGALLGALCSLAFFQLFDLDVPRRRGVLMAVGSSAAVSALTAWLQRTGGVGRAAAVGVLGLAALAGMEAADRGPVRTGLPPLEAASPSPSADAPDIVLLTLDTTRFDAVGFHQPAGSYDRARSTTPNLDELSSFGVRFTAATAPAPHTHPSMASVLTGLDPAVHGSVSGAPMLAQGVVTLAEHLRAQGYATAGFLDNPWLGETFGLSRGYEHLEMNARPERVIRWLDEPRDQPIFLHVHFFQPHGPYERRDVEALGGPRATAATRARIGDRFDANRIRDGEVPGSHGLTPEELDWLRELYHSEVRAMDADIGVLLERLTKRHRSRRSKLIAVAADHGEEFDERGSLHHSHTVHQELVHVPLMIYGPGGRAHGPSEVNDPVGLVDLAPTILDLAGLAPLPNVGTGVSLSPLMGADRDGTAGIPAPRLIVSQRERHAGGRRLLAARLGSWKLHVRTPPAEAGAALAPDEELDLLLYRLDLDPSESSDVAADHPDKVRELLGALRQWDTRTREQAARLSGDSREGPIPAAVDANLRALGYGGGR
jgi:arylsulfatase A-like enzyme